MSKYRSAPSFWWALASVFVGYLVASFGITLVAASAFASGRTGRVATTATPFLTSQVISLLVGSLVAAPVVYLLVNDGGHGPTFARVLLALVLGNTLRLIVLIVQLRSLQHLHGWQTNPAAPLVFALSSPFFAPFSFLGLLLSAAILTDPQRKPRAEIDEDYDYKQPPLQSPPA